MAAATQLSAPAHSMLSELALLPSKRAAVQARKPPHETRQGQPDGQTKSEMHEPLPPQAMMQTPPSHPPLHPTGHAPEPSAPVAVGQFG